MAQTEPSHSAAGGGPQAKPRSGASTGLRLQLAKPAVGGEEEDRTRSGAGAGTLSRKCDFSYNVWGQGALAVAARRYMEDIAVLHSTTMLTAQRHTRPSGLGGSGGAPPRPGAGPVLSAERIPDAGSRAVSDRRETRDGGLVPVQEGPKRFGLLLFLGRRYLYVHGV